MTICLIVHDLFIFTRSLEHIKLWWNTKSGPTQASFSVIWINIARSSGGSRFPITWLFRCSITQQEAWVKWRWSIQLSESVVMFSCCYPWNKLKFIDDSFCWRHKAAFSYFERKKKKTTTQRKLTKEVMLESLSLILHKTAWALNINQIQKRLHHWGSRAQKCSLWSRPSLSSVLCATCHEQPCKHIQSLPSLCFSSEKSKDNHTCFNGLFASRPFKGYWQSCLSRHAVASDRPKIIGS